MACRYEFTEEQIQELTNAAKANKRKDVDRRLRALLMRAKGNKLERLKAVHPDIYTEYVTTSERRRFNIKRPKPEAA